MLKTIAIAAAVIMMGAVPTTMASTHCKVPKASDCTAHCASEKRTKPKPSVGNACLAGCKEGIHLQPNCNKPCGKLAGKAKQTCSKACRSMSKIAKQHHKCKVKHDKEQENHKNVATSHDTTLPVQEATVMEKLHESKMAHGSKDSLETHAAYNAGQEHRYDETLSTGEKGTVGNIESAQRDHHTTKPAHTRDNKAPIIGDDSHHLSALERMHKRATDHGKKDHVHPAL